MTVSGSRRVLIGIVNQMKVGWYNGDLISKGELLVSIEKFFQVISLLRFTRNY